MTVTPALLATARVAHGRIQLARKLAPMATAALWHREPPLTSQRTAYTEDLGTHVHFVRGGKGAGKSEAGAQLTAAMARGRKDPQVVEWARRNGFPIRRIPIEPALIIVSAASHQVSATTIRPMVAKLLPPGTSWSYYESKTNEAEARLPNGCKIRFMAATQPRDQFQSMAVDFAWLDEEHAEDLLDEVVTRVLRKSWPGGHGFVLVTATPQTALTNPAMAWTMERFDGREGYTSSHIEGLHSPFLNRHAREVFLASLKDPRRRALEEAGSAFAPGGVVFDAYDRRIHVVPPVQLDPTWIRRGALDIAPSAPTAYLATAYDPQRDQIHVYDGYYLASPHHASHAGAIVALHAARGEPPPPVLGDFNTPDAVEIMVAYTDAGLRMGPADKSFQSGLSAVADRLMVRERGTGSNRGERPGLVIHDTPGTADLRREIPLYIWDPRKLYRGGTSPESTRGADHACDCMRYIALDTWKTRRGQ